MALYNYLHKLKHEYQNDYVINTDTQNLKMVYSLKKPYIKYLSQCCNWLTRAYQGKYGVHVT